MCAEDVHRTALHLDDTYRQTMDSMTVLSIQKAVVVLYFAASARHGGVSHQSTRASHCGPNRFQRPRADLGF